jgi:hypothetical protein
VVILVGSKENPERKKVGKFELKEKKRFRRLKGRLK